MSGGDTKSIIKRLVLIAVIAGMVVNISAFTIRHFGYDILYGAYLLASEVAPQQAYATIPVIDYVKSIFDQIWKAIQVAWNYINTSVSPALRDLAAKKITDYITQQTLDWINNGTQPTFVGNWSQFANDAGNIAFNSVNDYLKTSGVDLCSPFVPQVQILLKGTYMSPQLPVSCSVDNFKQNISNSLNLVKNGGWISYTEAFMPDGNLIGTYISAENSFIGQAVTQKAARINEAISSSGFLGQKTCAKYDGGYTADSISQECGGDKQCIEYATEQWCSSWDIKTPGDVAGKAVANAITSDTQWGANIQYFTSAIVNALISKIFKTGLSSLQGSSITPGSDYNPTQDPNAVANFNQVTSGPSSGYQDAIYYFNSSDYPTLQVWKDVQSLAQEGTTSCTPPDDWITEYNNVTAVVNGIQTMVDEAQANLDQINGIDPATASTTDLGQAAIDIANKYQTFTNTYGSLLGDIVSAKQDGNMTQTQTLGLQEKDSLTTDLASAPACISPLTSQ